MKRLIIATICIFALLISVQSRAEGSKMNSSLKLLREINTNPLLKDQQRRMIQAGIKEDRTMVTIRFDHVLSPSEIAGYQSRGITFHYIDGKVARTGAIYPVSIPWSRVETVSEDSEILRMETSFKPAIYPLLDVSAPEIEADYAWAYDDDSGYPLTGHGMRIADFDTGIDVFHPAFFKADGDTFNWLDVNGNGSFDGCTDAVDLNGNGVAGSGERLCYFDGEIEDHAHVFGGSNPSNSGNGYQTYWDWLYNDANQNGSRDFGPGSGYGEGDPTFGELLFVVMDQDEDGELDTGEQLVALGTSKIYATMNADSLERVRGVDLTQSDPDDYGHGTGVSGILAGGWPGFASRFTGIAPDAEILMGNYFSNVELSYLIPWARNRGADVMLYEFGGFVYRFLDGSSLDEQLISTESETIFQVTPSGNLGRGNKHAIANVAASDTVILSISADSYGGNELSQLYGTTLWRTELSDLSFDLETPNGGEITITGGNQYVDGYYIWSSLDQSSRGTCKLDIYVDESSNPDVGGTWYLTADNTTGSDIEIISNIADNLSSWGGGATFDNYRSNDRNVTFPATSDSAFVNGSYSTRGFEGYGGVGGGSVPAGEISKFSGRGERIDGKHLVDICSPGNYDVYSTKSHTDTDNYPLGSFLQFSGTSAAGPHVAAGAALVQQKWPTYNMNEIAGMITSNAAADQYTGAVYNDTWGYGKLRLMGALGISSGVDDIAGGDTPAVLTIGQNYPNPFNPTTWIPFYVPAGGRVSIKLYDIMGRRITTLEDRSFNRGEHVASWKGKDHQGNPVSSGVYFCVIRQGNQKRTRKLVLIR